MAIVSTNNERFVAFDIEGGTIAFDYNSGTGGGTDTYNELGIVEGSVEIVKPDVERIVDMDKGAFIAVPRRGRATAGAIRFRLKASNDIGANTVATRSASNSDAAGGVPVFQVLIKRPDYRGAATGVSWTATNCHFARPTNVRAGTNHDEMDGEIVILGTLTEASY